MSKIHSNTALFRNKCRAIFLAASLFGSTLSESCFAQNQAVTELAPKPVIPPKLEPQGSAPSEVKEAPPLLAELKGIVFLGSIHLIRKSWDAQDIQVLALTVPQEERFKAEFRRKYLGKPFTQNTIFQIRSDVIRFYTPHDITAVDVLVPSQDLRGGAVQLVIEVGVLGRVRVTGSRWSDPKKIASAITAKPNAEVSRSRLEADLDWIDSNPFQDVAYKFVPGQTPGETDLELLVKDRFPARFYAGYEDSGNALTGFDHYLVGVNWGDAFYLHQGQQVNYQYTTSGDGEGLRAHSASYIVPLPWRNSLTFFGNYIDSKSVIPGLALTGRTYQISGRYSIPLPTWFGTDEAMVYRHNFSTGFDYKYNKDGLEYGVDSVTPSVYDVDQFVASYDGTLVDAYGQTSFTDQLYVSPGAWGGNNNDTAFGIAHVGASSSYVYNNVSLERDISLPENAQLVLKGTLQTCNQNLVPSEQLGFGGYDSIRGYDEREVSADEGYFFTAELRSPPLSLTQLFKSRSIRDELVLLGFWDAGSAYNHRTFAGERNQTGLSSVGFGIRYTINSNFSLRYDCGYQLTNTHLNNDHGSRSDLGIVLSY